MAQDLMRLYAVAIAFASSGSAHHGVNNPLLKLFSGGDPFASEIEPLEGIDHRGKNLGSGELNA